MQKGNKGSGLNRLFIAINLPDALKEKISEKFSKKIRFRGIRPIKAQNLHITLKFLGHIDNENEKMLIEKMGLFSFQEFELTAAVAGTFNARVIWIGIEDKQGELEKINGQINELLGTAGKKLEAHITLARNKSLEKEEVKKIVHELNAAPFRETFLVKSIDLMQSMLGTPGGPKHSKVFQKEAG